MSSNRSSPAWCSRPLVSWTRPASRKIASGLTRRPPGSSSSVFERRGGGSSGQPVHKSRKSSSGADPAATYHTPAIAWAATPAPHGQPGAGTSACSPLDINDALAEPRHSPAPALFAGRRAVPPRRRARVSGGQYGMPSITRRVRHPMGPSYRDEVATHAMLLSRDEQVDYRGRREVADTTSAKCSQVGEQRVLTRRTAGWPDGAGRSVSSPVKPA